MLSLLHWGVDVRVQVNKIRLHSSPPKINILQPLPEATTRQNLRHTLQFIHFLRLHKKSESENGSLF